MQSQQSPPAGSLRSSCLSQARIKEESLAWGPAPPRKPATEMLTTENNYIARLRGCTFEEVQGFIIWAVSLINKVAQIRMFRHGKTKEEQAFKRFKNNWRPRNQSIAIKIRLFNTKVKSKLVYGS